LKKYFWSAKACRSKAKIPLCGAFAFFTLVRELDFPNHFRAGIQFSHEQEGFSTIPKDKLSIDGTARIF